MATHPEVMKADADAAAEFGAAYPMGARMMSGHTDWHEKLQERISCFCSKRSCLFVEFWLPGNGFYH